MDPGQLLLPDPPAAAAAPLTAASTSTSVEVIPDPHDDCILDVPEMPDIPPSQPTSESFALRRPSHTETTTAVRRGNKRPAPAADDSTSTDKRAIDEMQSQREQSNELARLSRDLLQTLRPTASLDKHHMCGYLSSQFNELRPEIWKRYRTRFFLLCEEMVAENDAANAAQRQGQQQQQQPLHQQPQQQQQHVHNEWQPPLASGAPRRIPECLPGIPWTTSGCSARFLHRPSPDHHPGHLAAHRLRHQPRPL